MVFLASYLLFIATLASYRKSRYWPQHVEGFGYLSSGWIQWGSLLAAFVLFIWQQGWMMGCLLMLLAYLTIVSLLIFFANCSRKAALLAVIIFHVILMLCFTFSI